MLSNLTSRTRLAAGLALSVALAACSSLHGARHESSAAPAASAQAPAAAAPAPAGNSLTATQAAVEAAGPAPQAQPAAAPVPVVNPTAPMTYTVKRGDTLWGIASMFLRDPWDWPEVWYINPQIHNPHLIYPGDKLALAYGHNGRPQIRLVSSGAARLQEASVRLEPRLRSTPLASAIPTIPYAAIAPFLKRPTVLTLKQMSNAPHIIAFRGEHQVAGSQTVAYISNLGPDPRTRYSVIHVGARLRDPESGRVLGYLGTYTATALISQPVGNPARAVLIDTARETLRGDRLFATEASAPLTLEPRAPSTDVNGRIVWVVGGTGVGDLAGQYDIVVINRGTRAGLEPGNVLAVDSTGQVVHDVYGNHSGAFRAFGKLGYSFAPRVKLPDERAGTLLVFKCDPRLSFALVVGATRAIRDGDVVHNP
jgi:LysM repeat protein